MLIRQFSKHFTCLFIFTYSCLASSNSIFTYSIVPNGAEITGCIDECPTEIVIPQTIDGIPVKSIGTRAFSDMGITSLVLEEGLIDILYYSFEKNKISNLIIPDSVEFIAAEAFANNEIKTLHLGRSLNWLSSRAFMNNLIEGLIIIPDNVERLSAQVFENNFITEIFFKGNRPEIPSNLTPFRENNIEKVWFCPNKIGWDSQSYLSAIEGVMPTESSECSEAYSTFDIDQSGSVDALSDGLILLRYFFGLRGDALINDVISPDANRTSAADIEAYIESHMP